MAKAVKIDWQKKITNSKWGSLVLAVVFLAVAYGFASLAVDSGSLLEYALAALFLASAIKALRIGIHNLHR